ncbi:MAG: DUF2089 family protein, partial [candidate division WOR-3 bacterium]
MNKKILFCPLCNEMLKISELKCSKCNITLRGDFSGCEFCSLTPENREFLKIYLRCEGNIKKIERILGISYPTVKSKIDSLLS